MTCVLVNFNSHFNINPSSLAYAHPAATSPKLAEAPALFIQPSVLHSQLPTNSQTLLKFCSKHQEDASEQAKAAVLLSAVPASQLPQVEQSLDLEVAACQNPRQPTADAPATAACQGPGHTTLTEWVRRFGEQPVSPPRWETELAPSIHQTLREREVWSTI